MLHGGSFSSDYAHWLKKQREKQKLIYCSFCRYHRRENRSADAWRYLESKSHKLSWKRESIKGFQEVVNDEKEME